MTSPDFSLCRGGPLYLAAQSLGIARGSSGLLRIGVALAAVTWVPPALLTLAGGVLDQGSGISLWQSSGTHVRLLLAIPLFFLAESLFDARCGDALRRIVEIRLITPADQPTLAAAIRTATSWRDSWLMEGALALLAVGMLWSGLRADLPKDALTWRTTAGGGLTPAGWWYTLVSVPVFQFLFWRWCWRLAIWSTLLWRIARMDLQLIPTHPDRAGGLAVLGVAHVDLAPLSFAVNAVAAASYAEQVLYAGVPMSSFAVPLTAAAAGTTFALIAPLGFFASKLLEAKQDALLEYGTLAAHYTRAFATKWLPTDPPPDEPILGTPDIQSLADLGSSFDLIRQMTILPMAKSQIVLLAAAAVVPFAPLVLTEFPLDQIILDSLKAVLNI